MAANPSMEMPIEVRKSFFLHSLKIAGEDMGQMAKLMDMADPTESTIRGNIRQGWYSLTSEMREELVCNGVLLPALQAPLRNSVGRHV
jgi:hypothetical protein